MSNAAHQSRKSALADVTDEEFDRTFKTNIYAYFRLTRAALPHLKPGAAIIATSSETGIMGAAHLPDYSSTKGAINAFTKALAIDLVERGIRVNAVAPGPVWTPLNPSDAGLTAKKVAKFGAKNPMGRPAQPEELAPAYVFLASDADSSYNLSSHRQQMTGLLFGRKSGSCWLPHSGYQLAARSCFEYYPTDGEYDEKTRTFTCELCMPIAKL